MRRHDIRLTALATPAPGAAAAGRSKRTNHSLVPGARAPAGLSVTPVNQRPFDGAEPQCLISRAVRLTSRFDPLFGISVLTIGGFHEKDLGGVSVCGAATIPVGQSAHAAAASLSMLGAAVSSLQRARDLGAKY